jgi:hypothetical protein
MHFTVCLQSVVWFGLPGLSAAIRPPTARARQVRRRSKLRRKTQFASVLLRVVVVGGGSGSSSGGGGGGSARSSLPPARVLSVGRRPVAVGRLQRRFNLPSFPIHSFHSVPCRWTRARAVQSVSHCSAGQSYEVLKPLRARGCVDGLRVDGDDGGGGGGGGSSSSSGTLPATRIAVTSTTTPVTRQIGPGAPNPPSLYPHRRCQCPLTYRLTAFSLIRRSSALAPMTLCGLPSLVTGRSAAAVERWTVDRPRRDADRNYHVAGAPTCWHGQYCPPILVAWPIGYCS